ncbi:MAG: MTH1187 family thiamine-binding protein [Candidatus Latescibacteria bacterium]|nr:MTH1187 family thiamine-binding protein [Candidatus Latescibacterota bacterium]NIM66384.1 MTH1187 family thiamine-binding protein [Candidatus Latescibacterota bacterium]NIO02863.1 MTH1187 family thiamine-binding protein [Candidatus Latescibacterota bacterium]NIO29998.1 MTH1187 family thiamine-binding protein [Candidatus Latescibacterota bacterium]NIO57613.1 MTH1187 family thiamine-binding protein [Candidatus Latescibacterota bacterium]
MIAFFSVVPMGKESLSEDVSKVIDVIDKSGIEYRLTSMGTIVEGSPDDVWDLIRKCHDKMRELSRRVITHVAVDDRESAVDSIRTKVNDIEKHLSRKLKT